MDFRTTEEESLKMLFNRDRAAFTFHHPHLLNNIRYNFDRVNNRESTAGFSGMYQLNKKQQ
ncbi:MAG: hypothetical protein R2847_06070 [Bacteroidia bacterium]